MTLRSKKPLAREHELFRRLPMRCAQAVLPAIKPLEWKGSLVRAANEPPLPDGTLVRVLEI